MARTSRKKVQKTVAYTKETSGKLDLPKPDEIFTPTKPKMKKITGRTDNQKDLIKKLNSCDLTLVSGVAGTGKTLISVAIALEHLEKEKIERIIITRPLVTAGEEMGFLPGDIDAKTLPFLYPIYDSFLKFVNEKQLSDWKRDGVLQIAPIGMLRGRSLDNAFIIVDETQNCTLDQIKMVITRLGENSKMVINGDPTQSDLPSFQRGAFQLFCERLTKFKEIAVVYLSDVDIQRHPLLTKLIPDMGQLSEKDLQNIGQRTPLEDKRPPNTFQDFYKGYADYDNYEEGEF